MKYIVENWFVIVGLIAVCAAGGYAVYVFVKMPSDKQLNKVREWLLYAVTKAEKELGGGTGQIKLRYVYDMFVARFKSNAKVDVAHGFNKSLAGTYKVTASGLNLRAGAGTGKSILAVMKNGEKVQCYGYYNDCNGVKWLYVVYKNIVGYASSKYLSK